jgi:hypothetical protein
MSFKISKSDYLLLHVGLSVHPSVLMEQFGSPWTDFRDILCLSIFRNFVSKNSN